MIELTLVSITQLLAVSWAVLQGLLTIVIGAFTPLDSNDYAGTYTKIKGQLKYLAIASIIVAIILLILTIILLFE